VLLNSGMNLDLSAALRATLKSRFIPQIKNATEFHSYLKAQKFSLCKSRRVQTPRAVSK
jgi:hypothetical protein